MKKAIFITVRTGSTRLPEKCLLEINGKTTIEHLIERVKLSRKADIIVLCTTELKEDEILCQIAKKNEILCYRGSVNDKLERWKEAALKYNVEFFVTADGDDLFCDPELIDIAFSQYERGKPDFIEGKDLICGAFSYGIKTSALQEVCRIKDTDDTEMMWVYFKNTNMFKVEELEGFDKIYRRPEIRMTLDYYDDFRFFRHIIEKLDKGEKYFSLRDVIEYLDKNPDIILINQYLQKEWEDNQKKKTKLLIKKLPDD